MEHRVKVTVLDKKLFPELQAQYCAVPDSGNVLVTMLEMNLCFIATMSVMTIGIWEQAH